MKREDKTKSTSCVISPGILSSLDKNSEVCLVRVPKKMDPNILYNKDITSGFSSDGSKFSSSVIKGEADVKILGMSIRENGSPKLVTLMPKKVYTIREEIDELPPATITIPPRYVVPKLTDLKERHPIYGAEYVANLKRTRPESFDNNVSPKKKKKGTKK